MLCIGWLNISTADLHRLPATGAEQAPEKLTCQVYQCQSLMFTKQKTNVEHALNQLMDIYNDKKDREKGKEILQTLKDFFAFLTKLCHFAPPPGGRGKMAELRKETACPAQDYIPALLAMSQGWCWCEGKKV